LLWLNNRSTRSLENYKTELARSLAQLQHTNAQATLWHERRVSALVEIYDAFRLYLDFLRRALYVPRSRVSLDPYHDFRRTLDKNLLYLDDDLQSFVTQLQGELLLFWNWAHGQVRKEGITDDAVQQKLDYEVPLVLERLRQRVNLYADPRYKPNGPGA